VGVCEEQIAESLLIKLHRVVGEREAGERIRKGATKRIEKASGLVRGTVLRLCRIFQRVDGQAKTFGACANLAGEKPTVVFWRARVLVGVCVVVGRLWIEVNGGWLPPNAGGTKICALRMLPVCRKKTLPESKENASQIFHPS
jgi:hypothetical protein